MTKRLRVGGGVIALTAVFGLLALLNTGGYRYGASDQAFYVPAVLRHADPSLFPRDREMLDAEARFMVFDELMGTMAAVGPASTAHLMFAAYVLMLTALAASGWAFGRAMYSSHWTATALVLAMSLRHRIAKTGVNTLEANFHPRLLAFAVGVLALAACLRHRLVLALLLAAAAVPLHPTTGLWFGIATIVTVFVVVDRTSRLRLAGAGLGLAGAAVWLVFAGPLRGSLIVMDSAWLEALAQKDYLFPTEWEAETWGLNVVSLVTIALLYWTRRRTGLSTAAESGLAASMGVLFLVFLAALPFVHWRVALAVQLQVSRALWVLDFVAVALLVWWLVEAPWPRLAGSPQPVRRWMVLLIAVAATARGAYVTFVERAGDPILTIDVPQDDWGRAMTWLEATPTDTHVLADSGHAWRYGTSVRVAAGRDVYLEESKDAALALYSRETAARVLGRIRQLDDFSRLTPRRALELGASGDLDYLVTEAELRLPVAFRSGRITVYRLRPAR